VAPLPLAVELAIVVDSKDVVGRLIGELDRELPMEGGSCRGIAARNSDRSIDQSDGQRAPSGK